MHILEPSLYTSPQRDHITLPAGARTTFTSFRWWQAISSGGTIRATWALDDIIIGGREINPSTIFEDFTDDVQRGLEFFPNGIIENNICGGDEKAMVWKKAAGIKMVTTKPLIVQHGHILQFKVCA